MPVSNSTISVYCDESCHLENDGIGVMVLGAVHCERRQVARLSREVRRLKVEHGLSPSFEIKWTKISRGKRDFYLALIDLFFSERELGFRGVVIPDKSILDHRSFDQTHDDWYYKMYFLMLRYVLVPGTPYHIYLDIKDTRGGAKTRRLHTVLATALEDRDSGTVQRVQQIRSHESELMQIADLLIGAIGYERRGLSGNAGKRSVVDRLKARGADLSRSSRFAETKFNMLVWRPRGDGT